MGEIAQDAESDEEKQAQSRKRRESRSLYWSGPSTTGGGAVINPEQDVEMEDVERAEPDSRRIINAPSLPVAPKHSGSTMKDRRAFMTA